MKRYAEIFWWPFSTDNIQDGWLNFLPEPKHYYPLLKIQREGAAYLKCPAIAETFKNSFVVCCPFDMVLSFDKKTKSVTTDRYGQEFYDAFIVNRCLKDTYDPKNPMVFSIVTNYVFFSDDSVEIELRDVPLLTSSSTSNIKILPGKFNISKWLRTIEFAAEVIDDTKPVVLKAGDPLYMITFTTKNNVPVKLTRRLETDELRSAVFACTGLKRVRPGLKLRECYEIAESYITALKRWVIK
jgi:hypothetical protein